MRNYKRLLLSAAFVLLTPSFLFALDMAVTFRLENLGFAVDRTLDVTTFAGENYLWGLSIIGTHSLAENFEFETGYYNDSILRNITYSLFSFRESIISIGVGPFIGVFNADSTILKSGISTAIRAEVPGIAFASFRADSTIGGRLVEVGDYIQERNDVTVGFYAFNAVCSFNMLSKKFAQKQTESLEVVDGLNEYSFNIDLYQKYTPYMLGVTFAYQNLVKSYSQESTLTIHSLNSIMLGIGLEMFFNEYFTYSLDLESSIYTWGSEALINVSNTSSYLFHFNTGIQFNMDAFAELTGLY